MQLLDIPHKMMKWLDNLPQIVNTTKVWIGLYVFYAIMKNVLTIDCYECSSRNGDHKECEDEFVKDITTYNLISRDCYYGYWKANFCIKLKGKWEDGTTILVRQCAVKDWGSHCGLIQFETSDGTVDIDGCLKTCDYDGCNLATTFSRSFPLCISVICFLWTIWFVT